MYVKNVYGTIWLLPFSVQAFLSAPTFTDNILKYLRLYSKLRTTQAILSPPICWQCQKVEFISLPHLRQPEIAGWLQHPWCNEWVSKVGRLTFIQLAHGHGFYLTYITLLEISITLFRSRVERSHVNRHWDSYWWKWIVTILLLIAMYVKNVYGTIWLLSFSVQPFLSAPTFNDNILKYLRLYSKLPTTQALLSPPICWQCQKVEFISLPHLRQPEIAGWLQHPWCNEWVSKAGRLTFIQLAHGHGFYLTTQGLLRQALMLS